MPSNHMTFKEGGQEGAKGIMVKFLKNTFETKFIILVTINGINYSHSPSPTFKQLNSKQSFLTSHGKIFYTNSLLCITKKQKTMETIKGRRNVVRLCMVSKLREPPSSSMVSNLGGGLEDFWRDTRRAGAISAQFFMYLSYFSIPVGRKSFC